MLHQHSESEFIRIKMPLHNSYAANRNPASIRVFGDGRDEDGIPTFVVWDRGRKPLTNSAPEDCLPLYHIPCT
jgi:hypothetical protein